MYITFLLYLVLTIFFLDVLGRLVTSFFLIKFQNSYKQIFLNQIAGLIILTTSYSIIFSEFKTINLGLLLIGGFLLPQIKVTNPPTWTKYSYKQYLIIFLLIIFNFTLTYFSKFPSSTIPFPIYFGDHLFYSEISDSLNKIGAENSLRIDNLLSNEFLGTNPYHYFDLWFNACIGKTYNTSYIEALELIANPLIRTLIVLGIISLLENESKLKWGKFIISISSIFISGLYIKEFHSTFPILTHWSHNVSALYNYPKLAFNSIFILGALVFFKNKPNLNKLVPYLLILPIINIANAPGVLTALTLTTAYHYYLTKNWKDLIKQLFFIFSITIFIMIFYRTTPSPYHASLIPDIKATIVGDVPQKIKLIVGQFIALLVFYGPFLLLFFIKEVRSKIISFFKENLLPFATFALGSITALLFSNWLYIIGDSYQFFDNIFIPLINISILIVLYFTLTHLLSSSGIKRYQYTIFTMVILSLFSIYSINTEHQNHSNRNNYYSSFYLSEISKVLKTIDNPIGAGIFNINKNASTYTPYYVMNNLGSYLPLMNKNFSTVNISTYDLHILLGNGNRYSSLWNSAIFTRFAYAKKQEGKIMNSDQIKVDFIKKFKIQYIIAEKNAKVPSSILSASNIIIDPKSGERFIVLKHSIKNIASISY